MNGESAFGLDPMAESLVQGPLAPVRARWGASLRALAHAYWRDYSQKSKDLTARTDSEAVDEFARVLRLSNTIRRELERSGVTIRDADTYSAAMQALARTLLHEQSQELVIA